MEESDISKCKICGRLEVRRFIGYFPDGKNKKFVGADDAQWNGRRCPSCVRNEVKTHIKQKRADAKSKSDA
jgi:hypothetical protein